MFKLLVLFLLNSVHATSSTSSTKLARAECTDKNDFSKVKDDARECKCEIYSWKSDEYLRPEQCVYPVRMYLHGGQFDHVEASHLLTKEQRENVEVLDISHADIRSISEDLLVEFPNLLQLVVFARKLDDIVRNDTDYLKRLFAPKNKLELLDLYSNLPSLPADTFANLKNLSSLRLSGNSDMCNDWQDYELSDKLEEIEISRCNISLFVTSNIEKLKNLKVIKLDENNLTIEEIGKLGHFPKLEKLKLSSNYQITKLKSYWLNSTSLKRLDLTSMHHLTEVDNCAFCGLPNLRDLSFWGSSKLHTIHPNAFGARDNLPASLETLSLNDCDLKVLPEKLVNLYELKISINTHTLECDIRNRWVDWSLNVVDYSMISLNHRPKLKDRCVNSTEWQYPESVYYPNSISEVVERTDRSVKSKRSADTEIEQLFKKAFASVTFVLIVISCLLIACLVFMICSLCKLVCFEVTKDQNRWDPVPQHV